MQETFLGKMTKRLSRVKGGKQENHQNGDKTRADCFGGSAGIEHPRPDRPTKGQTHAAKVQVCYGICGPVLWLHLICLPAKTPHQRRNGDGEARFRTLSQPTWC